MVAHGNVFEEEVGDGTVRCKMVVKSLLKISLRRGRDPGVQGCY
jgi:hypothetical protein